MTAISPTRPITAPQARLAQLIADVRWLSYAQIGKYLDPPIAPDTVVAYAKELSLVLGADAPHAYPPRIQITLWVKQLEWNLGHPPRIAELVDASVS